MRQPRWYTTVKSVRMVLLLGIAVLVAASHAVDLFGRNANAQCLRIVVDTTSDWTSVSISGADWDVTEYEVLEGHTAPDLLITPGPDLGVNKRQSDQRRVVVSFQVSLVQMSESIELAVGKGHVGATLVTVYECGDAGELLVEQFTHAGVASDTDPLNRRYFLLPTAPVPALQPASAYFEDVNQDQATLVLFNGTVVTMIEPTEPQQAIAIAGARILAVGTNSEILALANPNTELIDLAGAAVYPGFIDPHTHFLGSTLGHFGSIESAQEQAVRHGVTMMAEMGATKQQLLAWRSWAEQGKLRIRHRVYLVYNDVCGHGFGHWYEEFAYGGQIAPHLEIGGVKLFVEESVCSGLPRPAFSSGVLARATPEGIQHFGSNVPFFTARGFADVLRRIDELGLQIAIHSIGDAGTDVCLTAIASVLEGRTNVLRHMILHNSFLRDDQIDRYCELDIVALVEPFFPCIEQTDERYLGPQLYHINNRWAELIRRGLHVALDSDFPGFGGLLAPLERLRKVVTGIQELDFAGNPASCRVTGCEKLTVWEALRMMTIEAAYAMHHEDELGTLAPGKIADVVVLSSNPLSVELEELKHIEVLLTMIGGRIEFEAPPLSVQLGSSPVDPGMAL